MKYSLHIALSNEFKGIFTQFSKNISKKGNGLEKLLSTYIFSSAESSPVIENITLAPHSIYDFIPLDKDNVAVEFSQYPLPYSTEELSSWLNIQYNERVNIKNNVENALNICLYVCLWEKDAAEKVKFWVDSIKATNRNITVDILALNHDLSHVVCAEPVNKIDGRKQSCDTVQELTTLPSDCVRNVILVQNRQRDGFALNFSDRSLAHFFAEFALLYAKDDRLFVSSAASQSKLRAIGLAIFNFDKYYFAEYLLSSSYIYMMEREGITDKDADVNALQLLIPGVIRKLYGESVSVLSDFWQKVVVTQQAAGRSEEEIAAIAAEEAQKYISQLRESLQAFIKSLKLTLPEKRAGLAMLLSEDDEIFVGEQYDTDMPDIDDCISEAAELFVSYHNEIVDNELEQFASLKPVADEECHVDLALKDIKALKQEIKTASQTARYLQDMVEQEERNIKADADSTKVLVGDNNTIQIGDTIIKIDPIRHEEKPFDQVYKPLSIALEPSADLRFAMPEIRNQGQVGACTAYSTVSVFEYLASSQEKTRLSELFVYYMSRTYTERTQVDEGTSIHDSIQSLIDYGVCPWDLWDNTRKFNEAPSEEARTRAGERKVTLAMSVEHNVEHFKSAISEGYPVMFGLKIYKSFATAQRGFVTWPEEGEEELGRHAMVMCGYSDEGKFFIVRNSWGTSFGDGGYCYIPYSYIADPEMLDAAYIIKEISVGERFAQIVKSKACVNFDQEDAFFRYAVARNLLAEEERKIKVLTDRYRALSHRYQSTLLLLTKPDVRKNLVKGKQLIFETKLEGAKAERNALMQRHVEEKTSFDKNTVKAYVGFAVTSLLLLVLAIVLGKYIANHPDNTDVLFTEVLPVVKKVCWYLNGLNLISLVIYFFVRRRKREIMVEEHNMEETAINHKIADYTKRQEILKLKSHIAGIIHTEMYNLKMTLIKKHKILKSFTANLLQWYGEEQERVGTLGITDDVPYIPALDDESLEAFFEDNKEALTADIHLYDLVEDYELSEEGIKKFKVFMKETVLGRIFDFCSDFKMSDYVLQNRKHRFLRGCRPADEFLTTLLNRSRLFVFFKPGQLPNDMDTTIVLSSSGLKDQPQWENATRQVFSQAVIQVDHHCDSQIAMMQWSEIKHVDDLDLQ